MQTVYIEEHQEAFKEIVKLHRVKKQKFTLIHIDDHSDMNEAIVSESAINNLTDESIDLISYSQLNYGNYIPPLLYTDIIEDVIWISNHNSERFSEIFINTEQKANDFISLLPIKTKVAGNIHKLITCRADTNLTHIYDFSNKSVIVSVDLDYFGSNDHLGELIELEITRNQFFELQNNIYNKVRCSFGSNLNVYSKDSRYYVKLFGLEPIPACKISENEIKANLATLRDFFVRHNLNPDLNIICKSESSGYTRQEVIKYFVENRINI